MLIGVTVVLARGLARDTECPILGESEQRNALITFSLVRIFVVFAVFNGGVAEACQAEHDDGSQADSCLHLSK